jgi:hypothetical protein
MAARKAASARKWSGKGAAALLTDASARFTFPGGKTEEQALSAGDVAAYPAGKYLPENLRDQPLETVLIELKR